MEKRVASLNGVPRLPHDLQAVVCRNSFTSSMMCRMACYTMGQSISAGLSPDHGVKQEPFGQVLVTDHLVPWGFDRNI